MLNQSKSAGASPVVVPGTPEFEQLCATIAADTLARDRRDISAGVAIQAVRDAQLPKLRLPKSMGGAGGSITDIFRIAIALGAADSNVAQIIRNHYAAVERCMLQQDKNPKFARLVQQVSEGKMLGLATTELGTQAIGARGFDSTLTEDGDGYRLNGKKFYTTGCFYMDIMLVSAMLPDGSLATAIVPTDREGVEFVDDWDGMGQKLTESGSTLFKNVRLSKDEITFPGEEERKPYRSTITQLYLTAIIAGICQSIVTDTVSMVKGRGRNFYHALADKPAEDAHVQETVGRLSANAYAAEAIVLRAAAALDHATEADIAGKYDPALNAQASLEAVKAKIVVDQLGFESATHLFDAGGASASRASLRLDRHWQNIRTLASHNPISYKARTVGALELLGEPMPSKGFY